MFILPWVAFAAVSSVIGLLGGGTAVGITIAVDQYQRLKGYKPGEGIFTERYDGFKGVEVSTTSTSSIGSIVALFATMYPELQKYSDKRYLFTMSEGRQLYSMMEHITKQHIEFLDSGIAQAYLNDPDEELKEVIQQHHTNMTELIKPVVVFFSQFPEARIERI